MKPEIANNISAYLDSCLKEKQAAATRAADQQRALAKNLSDFDAKKKEVIAPALDELVAMHKTKGFTLRIADQEERPNGRGGFDSPSISLDLREVHPLRRDPKPEFRLTFDKHSRNVYLYFSDGSNAGDRETLSLDSVTVDWIQESFVKYQSGQR